MVCYPYFEQINIKKDRTMYKVLLLVLLVNTMLFAAEATTKRKEGGYRTFQEMLLNSPSLQLEYYLDPLFDLRKEKRIDDNYIHKAVDRKDNLKVWIERKHGSFWGCCQKGVVHITPRTEVPHTTVPLHIFEKVSWFKAAEIPEDVVTVSTRTEVEHRREKIYKGYKLKPKTFYLHMQTGEQGLLTASKLKEFIADDAELLQDFAEELRQEELVVHYLEIYHRRLAERK